MAELIPKYLLEMYVESTPVTMDWNLINVIKLLNYEYPGELEQAIDEFVEYYNKHRYHESLDNMTPEDVYLGREEKVKTRREKIKEATLRHRRKWNLGAHTGWP